MWRTVWNIIKNGKKQKWRKSVKIKRMWKKNLCLMSWSEANALLIVSGFLCTGMGAGVRSGGWARPNPRKLELSLLLPLWFDHFFYLFLGPFLDGLYGVLWDVEVLCSRGNSAGDFIDQSSDGKRFLTGKPCHVTKVDRCQSLLPITVRRGCDVRAWGFFLYLYHGWIWIINDRACWGECSCDFMLFNLCYAISWKHFLLLQ